MYDRHGLFNDLYLFRVRAQLKIEDYLEIRDALMKLYWLSSLKYPEEKRIKAGIPTPIIVNFDLGFLDHYGRGLANLREVSNQRCVTCNDDKNI